MKGFFNYVLASMLGTFLLIVVLGIINIIVMLGVMSAIGSLTNDQKEISEKANLHLDFKTPVADRSSVIARRHFSSSTSIPVKIRLMISTHSFVVS